MDYVKNTLTDRTAPQAPAAPRVASAATGPAAAALPARSGGSFKDALEQRLPLVLARTAIDSQTDAGLRARTRLIEAAAVVREQGMPLRHQAARSALATAAGCYDWFFRDPSWTLVLSGPLLALTWERTDGSLVVDVCSCDPLTAPAGPVLAARAAAAWDWAADRGAPLALVRLLPLTAPTSALGMPSAQVRLPLAEATALANATQPADHPTAGRVLAQVAS